MISTSAIVVLDKVGLNNIGSDELRVTVVFVIVVFVIVAESLNTDANLIGPS